VELHGAMSQSPILKLTGIFPVVLVVIVDEVRPSIDT